MKQYLPIQIVNDNDEPIGGASMDEAHREGLKHRIAFVMVEDPSGKILLQKRSTNVAVYPNKWDVSAGGHVDVGESYAAAAERELKEELGLSRLSLQEVDSYYDETIEGWRQMKRFRKVYRVVIPADTQLKPNPEEVSDLRWVDAAELRQLVIKHPDEAAPGLIKAAKRYYSS